VRERSARTRVQERDGESETWRQRDRTKAATARRWVEGARQDSESERTGRRERARESERETERQRERERERATERERERETPQHSLDREWGPPRAVG